MKKINTFKPHHLMAMAAALTLAGAALPTYAGEGHDHGAAPARVKAVASAIQWRFFEVLIVFMLRLLRPYELVDESERSRLMPSGPLTPRRSTGRCLSKKNH